jgi:hypothetical protein
MSGNEAPAPNGQKAEPPAADVSRKTAQAIADDEAARVVPGGFFVSTRPGKAAARGLSRPRSDLCTGLLKIRAYDNPLKTLSYSCGGTELSTMPTTWTLSKIEAVVFVALVLVLAGAGIWATGGL